MPTSGIGAEFRRWNPDTGAWELIASVYSIDGPSNERDTIETTKLSNTDGYRSFIGSLRDGGEVSLGMEFERADYDLMKSDFETDSTRNYEIVLPDSETTSLEFDGLVTACPIAIATDDRITSDVTIKVSGKPVVNSGSGS